MKLAVTKSYAFAVQASLEQAQRTESLMLPTLIMPVLDEYVNPTPEVRYIAARKYMERFSMLQVWFCLYIIQSNVKLPQTIKYYDPKNPLCGYEIHYKINSAGLYDMNPELNKSSNHDSPYWRPITTNGATNFELKYFPLHLNLHLLNVIYYNSLVSEFFRDITQLKTSPFPQTPTQTPPTDLRGENLVLYDCATLQGSGVLNGFGTLIRSLALEPNAFPLILKLPSDEFLFLFVRNLSNDNNPIPNIDKPKDLNEFLTVAQQKEITKREPIHSYISSLNENGLKVLSYLSIKTCRKSDETFYYTPTEIYSLNAISSMGNVLYEYTTYLKHSYVISMFTIALKMLGSITLPRMSRADPHPFDSQLTESVRKILNPNYISQYDRKNTAYQVDPQNNSFDGYTFTSSDYWGIDKIKGKPVNGFDSYPDLLGLGDISSNSPSNNEIHFIEISQWDIAEGMKYNNLGKANNLMGSKGLIEYADLGKVTPTLTSDPTSGILVSDASVVDKGFLARREYRLPDTDTLFTRLRDVCVKQIIPSQKATSSGGKYFTKVNVSSVSSLSAKPIKKVI